jgi:hypothetical protein
MADERTRGLYGTPYDDTLNVLRAADSHAHEFVWQVSPQTLLS